MPRRGTIEHEKDSASQSPPLDSPPEAGNDGWLTATVSPIFHGNDSGLATKQDPTFGGMADKRRSRMGMQDGNYSAGSTDTS